MVEACCDVKPSSISSDSPPCFFKMLSPRLVRPHMLSGHDEIKRNREMFQCPLKKIIINIRQYPQHVLRRKLLKGGVRIGEGSPAWELLCKNTCQPFRNVLSEFSSSP